MPALCTIDDYMRANASLLRARILQQYRALHQFDDPVPPRIEGLLRKPFPAQTIAIMGLAKRWQEARTGMVVAECGTGKTLISLGGIYVHSAGKPFTALAMVPPHLVEKWAREAFLTLPGVRVFLIDDLRNGGRRKQVSWSERSAAPTGARRAGRIPHQPKRTAIAERIVEFPETLVVAVWETFIVRRGSGAGEARLFLAACLPSTALGPIHGLRRQFRQWQAGIRG